MCPRGSSQTLMPGPEHSLLQRHERGRRPGQAMSCRHEAQRLGLLHVLPPPPLLRGRFSSMVDQLLPIVHI